MKAYIAFQNSMKGIIVLYQNFNKGNLSLQFAIASNPKKPNEIQKGDKIYDYQNAKWFALSEEEACEILDWLMNPNPQSDKIEIKHYPQNGVTVFTVGRGQNGYYLAFSEIQNKQQVFHLALGLSNAQMRAFVNYLQTFPMVKTLSAYHDFLSWKDNTSANNGNQQYSRQQDQQFGSTANQTTSPQSTQSSPIPAAQPANPLSFIRGG